MEQIVLNIGQKQIFIIFFDSDPRFEYFKPHK